MNRKWTVAAAFAGGLVVGAVGSAALVGRHWERNFARGYVIQLADQANVAHEILSGRAPALAERIKHDLPEYVRAVDREFADAEGADWALWLVRDVYEAAGTPPPPDLEARFAALPARPTCKRPAAGRAAGGAPR